MLPNSVGRSGSLLLVSTNILVSSPLKCREKKEVGLVDTLHRTCQNMFRDRMERNGYEERNTAVGVGGPLLVENITVTHAARVDSIIC